MRKSLLLICCLLTILSLGCHSSTKKETQKAMKAGSVDTTCRPLTRTSTPSEGLNGGVINKVEVEDNCLVIHLTGPYSLEKKTEQFELRWNGKIKKSMPPQVSLRLHTNKEKENLSENRFILKYDISDIQAVNPNGRVFISLNDFAGKIEIGTAKEK